MIGRDFERLGVRSVVFRVLIAAALYVIPGICYSLALALGAIYVDWLASPGFWRLDAIALSLGLPALFLCLPYVLVPFTTCRQALHDKLSGTYVVNR